MANLKAKPQEFLNHKNATEIKIVQPEIPCKSQIKIRADAKTTNQITGCNILSPLASYTR